MKKLFNKIITEIHILDNQIGITRKLKIAKIIDKIFFSILIVNLSATALLFVAVLINQIFKFI
tara:strand:+ start:367 stop:555 length:189 start_codon:yes stop_codon:yes gene_type:complete